MTTRIDEALAATYQDSDTCEVDCHTLQLLCDLAQIASEIEWHRKTPPAADDEREAWTASMERWQDEFRATLHEVCDDD